MIEEGEVDEGITPPIEVEKAFYAGSKVEIKSKEDADHFPRIEEWEDDFNPTWNFGEYDYRIKKIMKEQEKIPRRKGDSFNNGGVTDYYEVPEDAVTLSDLIEHKSMEHGIGEAFAALYRLNDKDTRIRNLNKAAFFIDRAIDRELKKIRKNEPIEMLNDMDKE